MIQEIIFTLAILSLTVIGLKISQSDKKQISKPIKIVRKIKYSCGHTRDILIDVNEHYNFNKECDCPKCKKK